MSGDTDKLAQIAACAEDAEGGRWCSAETADVLALVEIAKAAREVSDEYERSGEITDSTTEDDDMMEALASALSALDAAVRERDQARDWYRDHCSKGIYDEQMWGDPFAISPQLRAALTGEERPAMDRQRTLELLRERLSDLGARNRTAHKKETTTGEWLDTLDARFAAEETEGWRTPANRTEREYAARQARMAVEELRYKIAQFDAALTGEGADERA